jgi:stage IV sporulation protein FB
MTNESTNWSLPLGRWLRLPVRVHALFIVVATYAIFLSASHRGQETPLLGALAVLVLLLSILAHEIGHAVAAVRVGGNPGQIVIGPLGGLSTCELPREQQCELITAVAGPLVNLGVLLATLPMLLAGGTSVAALLNPIDPGDLTTGAGWLVAAKITFWINWVLLSVNLLPAIPFDGARILRGLLWPALDYRSASLVVVRTSKLTALALCLCAWLVSDTASADVLPAWVPLVLLATLVFFSARQEGAQLEEHEWDEELFSYDFSQGYTSLEQTGEQARRPGVSLRRWLENRRELRRRRRVSQEREEERLVDQILIRLHESGMQGLTAKERAILNRVSQRYRNRQRS